MGATEAQLGLEFDVGLERALESEVGYGFEFEFEFEFELPSSSCRVRVPEFELEFQFQFEGCMYRAVGLRVSSSW